MKRKPPKYFAVPQIVIKEDLSIPNAARPFRHVITYQTEEVKRGDLTPLWRNRKPCTQNKAPTNLQTSGTIEKVNAKVGDLVKEKKYRLNKIQFIAANRLASIAE
jgi:hypothetical protein